MERANRRPWSFVVMGVEGVKGETKTRFFIQDGIGSEAVMMSQVLSMTDNDPNQSSVTALSVYGCGSKTGSYAMFFSSGLKNGDWKVGGQKIMDFIAVAACSRPYKF